MGEEILNTTQCNLFFFHVYLALVQAMVFLNDSKKWFKVVFNYMHITQPPESSDKHHQLFASRNSSGIKSEALLADKTSSG